MKRFFKRYTVLFRGNIVRNLIDAAKTIRDIVIIAIKVPWYIIRGILTFTLWIFGIDWIRIERNIYRKVRAYFA